MTEHILGTLPFWSLLGPIHILNWYLQNILLFVSNENWSFFSPCVLLHFKCAFVSSLNYDICHSTRKLSNVSCFFFFLCSFSIVLIYFIIPLFFCGGQLLIGSHIFSKTCESRVTGHYWYTFLIGWQNLGFQWLTGDCSKTWSHPDQRQNGRKSLTDIRNIQNINSKFVYLSQQTFLY